MADKVRKTTMETYDVKTFNQRMRGRTKMFAVSIYKILDVIKLSDLNRLVIKQLIRSATR